MPRPVPTSFAMLLVAGALACSGGQPAEEQIVGAAPSEETSASLRLYIFDCGHLRIADPGRFSLTMDEVSTLELSVPCYLIDHPAGTLLWDAGLYDSLAEGWPHTQANGTVTTVTATLRAQLEELGYQPADITYLEGYLWDPPGGKAAFRKAYDIAHANGRRVALTLSDSFCVERYRSEFLDLVA